MSVLSFLNALSVEAILTDAEKQSITTSINTLRNRLENDLGLLIATQFRFGSSTRGTMLPRDFDDESDIDYMVVFADSDKAPQTYLDRLRRFTDKWYSSSAMRQSSPSIVLELNHIKFDLVPAIPYNYFLPTTFQIPAPHSSFLSWVQTDPKGFNDDLTRKNTEHSSMIKPTIRLAKMWNIRAGMVFETYALEQAIVNGLYGYYSERNVKTYFFNAMQGLSLPWDAAQWRKDRLDRLKITINLARALENSYQLDIAEREIRKLF